MRKSFYLIFTCVLVYNCQPEKHSQLKKYLFLSHIYQWGVVDNNRIDYRFEGIDFENFDQIWLGGDLCARTAEKTSTIDYIDSIFDLSSDKTHWTLGNHDVTRGDIKNITKATKRNTFYASFFDGIGLVVLNTTEFYHPNYTPKSHECKLLDDQLSLLENIADTTNSISHLVLIHHLPLLNNQMTEDSLDIGKIFNFYHPEYLTSCEKAQPFDKTYYPIFKKIQKKGIQVVLIGGDLGQRAKEFEYQTKEGIIFLGSGINNSAIPFNPPAYVTNTDPDKILVFDHDIQNKILTWEFIELNQWIIDHKKSSAEK